LGLDCRTTIAKKAQLACENLLCFDPGEIEYITGDGSFWHSKCHSHSGGRVTFTFEHFPKDSDDSHEDSMLQFVDWDGKVWDLIAPDMNPPGTNPERVMLNLAPQG